LESLNFTFFEEAKLRVIHSNLRRAELRYPFDNASERAL
jgi:hypothetical protein